MTNLFSFPGRRPAQWLASFLTGLVLLLATAGTVAARITIPPNVTTTAPGSVTSTSAVLGGNVLDDYSAGIAARGVLYSTTNPTPTVGGGSVTQDVNGTGLGVYSKTIGGLQAGTTYYVRAYATNTPGTTGYGTVLTFTTAPAPTNNALAFDGSDDYVRSTGTLPATGEFTLEGWVNPTVLSGGLNSFLLTDNFPAGAMHCQFYGNNLGFTINGNNPQDVISTTALPTGKWNHVAVVYSASAKTVKFYLNGVLNTTGTYTTALAVAATQYSLGGWQNGGGPDRLFNGKYDEVRIYNTALTQAQVQADQFSTTAAVPASLSAYYNFNQGTAGGTNAGLTTLADQSGTGRTGTLTNFALTGTTSNFVRSFPTITGTAPTFGPVGTSVTVTGTNLLDATGFKFNGTAVSPFTTPTNDLTATTTVPAGATTGPVSVVSAALALYNGPAFSVTPPTAVTWTGTLSTAWATAGNWTPAAVPTNSIDVTIPAAPANQPLVSGTQAAKNVTVQAGARLTLAATAQLTLGSFGNGNLVLAAGSTLTQGETSEIYITGNMTNNGATFALDETSEIGFGITTTNHVLNGTAGLMFQTLTVGEQGSYDNLSMQVPVQVRRKLGVYNNSTTSLGTGGSLTLLSDAVGTAMVENGTGSTVGGPVRVQRYIDATLNPGIGYRHYSAPVSNTTVADLATSGFAPVLNTAYNTSATPGSTRPFPTVFGYDQSRLASVTNNSAAFDKGWVVPAAGTALVPGRGYAVNINGSELVDFVGTLNNGNVAVPLARNAAGTPNNADAGWQFLGNPYPATLDYALVAAADRPGLDAAMYTFESASQYGGGYLSYVNGIGGSNLVASGQGFFTRLTTPGTSGTFTFRNSQRLTSFYGAPARPAADPRPLVRLELRGSTGPADAFFAYAEAGATPAFDSPFDAVKMPNSTGLNLSSAVASGENLAIDGRAAFTAATVLPLSVGVPAAGSYTFTAAVLNNLPAGLDVYLTDAQTGQTVNLRTQPRYAFSVSAAQATALLVGRFSLSFAARTALATAPAAITAAQVQLYPNPAHARFTVLMPGVIGATAVQAELLNALGQVVRRQAAALPASGATLTVETTDLATGVYVLRLLAGPATVTKRVVIQ